MGEADAGWSKRVAATANRLRLVQIDFADQGDQVRREYLGDEIKRALAAIVPAERRRFLQELEGRFPTWDARVEVAPQSPPGGFDEQELKRPDFLTKRLLDTWGDWSDAQRRAVTSRLQEAGILGAGKPDWPPQAAALLRSKLGMGEKDPIDMNRLLDLTTMLAELVVSLDQVVWNAWRAIAPQANVKRPAAVQKTMGRFVANDQNVPRGQIAQDVNKLRMLIAALIAALSQSGRFAVQHYKNFAPEEIKALVGSRMLGSESAYWRKYVELAGSLDPAVVEAEIRKAIAEYAETVMG